MKQGHAAVLVLMAALCWLYGGYVFQVAVKLEIFSF